MFDRTNLICSVLGRWMKKALSLMFLKEYPRGLQRGPNRELSQNYIVSIKFQLGIAMTDEFTFHSNLVILFFLLLSFLLATLHSCSIMFFHSTTIPANHS